MEKIILTRIELYDLVWAEPLLTLSKRFNLSDNGLRKYCIRYKIPLPDAGFWMKKKYGKQVHIKPFISNFDGNDKIEIVIKEGNVIPNVTLKNQIEIDLGDRFFVAKRLTNPDPLIIKFKENLDLKSNYPHNYYIDSSDNLSIKVDKPNMTRAILFMDTLIKCLKFRGHLIYNNHNSTFVKAFDTEFNISMRVKTKRIENLESNKSWDKWKYVNTNLLVFKIDRYVGKEWIEGKKSLNDQIPSIIACIEAKGLEWKIYREDAIKKKIELEHQKQIELELKAIKDKEISRFKTLLANAERWKKFQILMEYISHLESSTINTDTGITLEYLNWAKEKAEWYDPSISRFDEILNDVDPNSL